MERKGNTAVVTTEEVVSGLKRVGTSTTPAEEKALRMRYGASVDRSAPLPRAAQGNEELEDELLLIEMHLLRALKHRRAMATAAASKGAAVATVTAPKLTLVRNPTKDKIVSKLRAKKK